MQTPDGPKQRAVYGKTRAEVAARLRKEMADRDNGVLINAGNLTLGEYLDRWLSDCVLPLVQACKLEHSTYIRYAGIVRNHIKPALGRRRLKDLNRAEVRRLYNEKGKRLSPCSVDYLQLPCRRPSSRL